MPFQASKPGKALAHPTPATAGDNHPESAHSKDALLSEGRVSEIAAFFKNHRLSLGLSCQEVAENIGVVPQLLESYELGQKIIPLDEIFALTNCLNIPPEDVLALIYDLANTEVHPELK